MTPDDRTARRYSTTDEFVKSSTAFNRYAVLVWLGTGVAVAAFALVAAAAAQVVLWWVLVGVTLLTCAIAGAVEYTAREQERKLRLIAGKGPYLTIGDAGLTYAGDLHPWADIHEIHVSDFRRGHDILDTGAVISLDIEYAEAVHTLSLDEMLPTGIIDVLLNDLRRTALEQGTPLTSSRTHSEYRAWVKGDPR